ncbi:MAG: glucosamine-6-phosphate deaminase [Brevinema sp.]
MKVIITSSHDESCRKTADLMIDIIKNNEKPVLGLATGGTAEQVYAELVKSHKANAVSFKNVETVNLDEYVGLSGDHDQSYRYFMNKHLFDQVDIDKNNTFVPVGDAEPTAELKRFQAKLDSTPRHFQLLGVGPNGHIAFNEPAAELHANAHIVSIADATIKANARYFATENDVPKTAFTQGMGDILKAGMLVLLATGTNKADAMKKLLLDDSVTTDCPCTFLKNHPNVVIFIDKALADHIGYKN